MKMFAVLDKGEVERLRRMVAELPKDSCSEAFEKRMKEDPDFALKHIDDLRTKSLLRPNKKD